MYTQFFGINTIKIKYRRNNVKYIFLQILLSHHQQIFHVFSLKSNIHFQFLPEIPLQKNFLHGYDSRTTSTILSQSFSRISSLIVYPLSFFLEKSIVISQRSEVISLGNIISYSEKSSSLFLHCFLIC